MVQTSELIRSIAANAAPVKRLRPPLVRAGMWILFALIVLALSAAGFGLREGLALRFREPAFSTGLVASAATGVLAAVAAFMVSLPDRRRAWLLLPLPSTALWLGSTGYQCLGSWVPFDPGGMASGEVVRCLSTLVLTGAPLSLSLLIMLRYASRVRAWEAALAGGLAVAGLTASAMSLFHALDASVMILIWNLGAATLITAAGMLFRRGMFALVEPD